MGKHTFRFVVNLGNAGVIEVKRADTTDRCILPLDVIMDNPELSDAQIDAGIPYGLPFGEFLDGQTEINLHNAGIWTLDDLHHKAQTAVIALIATNYHLTDVIKASVAYQENRKTIKPEKSKKEKKP